LSNGLVVLYADDPFDGEVVIKTGKAYYVSGATEMANVPMAQVTGLEAALDSKVALDGDDIKDTVVAFAEAGTRENIGTGESTATLFGKLKKWYTDLKTHAFTAPSTTQGTGTTTVPSDNLLKESSFARVYREATEISGITYPVAIGVLVKTISDQNLFNTMLVVGCSNPTENKVIGLPTIGGNPQTYGTLIVQVPGTDTLRMRVEYNREIGNGNVVKWIGGINRGTTPWTVNWKMLIDDSLDQTISGTKTFTASPIVPTTPSGPSSAVAKSYADLKVALAGNETISGVKTFATGATPLITDAPTTDLMAVNKAYVDGLTGLAMVYDKVIRTQAEFEALIDSPNWLDAVSVALVGQFTLSTANNSGIKIPATVKQIHGFNGAKITVTNFLYNSSTAKGGLWYATRPTTPDYSIRDLEVDCTGTSGSGFYNCNNLSNCTGTGTGGSGFGFYYCDNLSNCTGTGTGTGVGDVGFGFYYCNNLSNCKGEGTGTGGTGSGYGFCDCDYVSNCKGEGMGKNGYGFFSCDYISNCTGTGTGTISGYGFSTCKNISNCTGKGVDSTDASNGFGFYNITRASNCKDGGSDTDMWAGVNKGIDPDTCRKNAGDATNSTLNT